MEQKKLGFWALFFMLAGTMIGPSICIYIGYTMEATGLSAWLCIFVAMALGLLLFFPMYFMSKYVRLTGGTYSVVSSIGGRIFSGIYAYSAIVNYMTITSMALGAAAYVCSVLTGANQTVVAFIILVAITVLNLFDIKAISGAQSGMTITLVACLGAFAIVGLCKITQPIFGFSEPDFFAGGFNGFYVGVGLLATMGQTCQYATSYTDIAQRPKRDIPKIMLSVPMFLIVFYVLVTWAAEGVLPMEEVAGQGTLTPQANYIFGSTLGTVFVLAGPLLALLTSLNGFYVAIPAAIRANAADGWYPKAFLKENKFGGKHGAVIPLFIICAIPLIFGLDIVTLTQWSLLMGAIAYYMMIYCFFKFPTKYKDVIEKSDIKFNKGAYYTFCVLAFLAETFFTVYSVQNMDKKVLPFCIGFVVVVAVVGYLRGRSSGVKILPLKEY